VLRRRPARATMQFHSERAGSARLLIPISQAGQSLEMPEVLLDYLDLNRPFQQPGMTALRAKVAIGELSMQGPTVLAGQSGSFPLYFPVHHVGRKLRVAADEMNTDETNCC
jgi:hypothetical protein